MKTKLFLDANPIKKRSYKLDNMYKYIVMKETYNMLEVGIIYLANQSKWATPIIAQPKKHDPKKLQVFFDFKWLNRVTLTYPFPTPFVYEIINEVVGHEPYSFTHGFSSCDKVPIAKIDQENRTFVFELASFAYKVMPFGFKSTPIILSRIAIKKFEQYLYESMAYKFHVHVDASTIVVEAIITQLGYDQMNFLNARKMNKE